MSPNHGSRFNGLAKLEDQENGTTAKLLKQLCYTTKAGWMICVPKGFETDFASIPRLLWAVIPPRGRYNRPAIIHDYLYHHAPIVLSDWSNTSGRRVTQAEADSILREACENCDDRFTQRWAIYLGLRLGGWVAWRNYRNKERA